MGFELHIGTIDCRFIWDSGSIEHVWFLLCSLALRFDFGKPYGTKVQAKSGSRNFMGTLETFSLVMHIQISSFSTFSRFLFFPRGLTS